MRSTRLVRQDSSTALSPGGHARAPGRPDAQQVMTRPNPLIREID
ncbi:hypothetical protein ACFY7Z_16500 [Streptomyces sp. NPDC012623]